MTATAPAATVTLATPLTLACGVTLPNRIAKAAMSEQLGEISGSPSQTLTRLYTAWGSGGAGLLITGNVMIDRRAYVEPRNVVLEDDRHLDAVARWARAGSADGSIMVMQINHPGRVALAPLYRTPVAPSATRPEVLGLNLRKPHALTGDQIADIRRAYARTAGLAVAAGFAGVQIHAAHGFLLSQFLSPAANKRDDEYGGTAANRRRLLLEIVDEVRAAIGPNAIVSVKLNSADFHRGGLTESESLDTALALEQAGIDLLEVSGGNYEAPAMTGVVRPAGRAHEAYFRSYAERLRARSAVTLMLTGGNRSAAHMNAILASGSADVIGLARPFALQPDVAERLLNGSPSTAPYAAPRMPLPFVTPVNAYLQLAWHATAFTKLARGERDVRGPSLPSTLIGGGTRLALRALTTL